MGRVVVFGSLNVDLVTRVDRFPKAGETLMGNGFAMVPGGKGANQALASARAGVSTLMFGAVGEDKNAEIATELLLDAGVDMTGVKAVSTTTGTASIFIDNGGENFIAVVAGANGEVREHFADEVISALHSDDILLLQGEIPAASMIAVLKAAQEKGVVSLFNTAPIIAQTVELANSPMLSSAMKPSLLCCRQSLVLQEV